MSVTGLAAESSPICPQIGSRIPGHDEGIRPEDRSDYCARAACARWAVLLSATTLKNNAISDTVAMSNKASDECQTNEFHARHRRIENAKTV